MSVDCVVFGYDTSSKSWNDLLIPRYLTLKDYEDVVADDDVLVVECLSKSETLDKFTMNEVQDLYKLIWIDFNNRNFRRMLIHKKNTLFL